jgi:dihydroceramidase
MFVWLGVKGIRNCIKYSHPSIFLIAFVGYIVVGLGSISFHATLKCKPASHLSSHDELETDLVDTDPMQLVDELSMIYTTCLMMYASFSFSRSRAFSAVLGVSLLGLAAFITVSLTQAEAAGQG